MWWIILMVVVVGGLWWWRKQRHTQPSRRQPAHDDQHDHRSAAGADPDPTSTFLMGTVIHQGMHDRHDQRNDCRGGADQHDAGTSGGSDGGGGDCGGGSSD